MLGKTSSIQPNEFQPKNGVGPRTESTQQFGFRSGVFFFIATSKDFWGLESLSLEVN